MQKLNPTVGCKCFQFSLSAFGRKLEKKKWKIKEKKKIEEKRKIKEYREIIIAIKFLDAAV